MRYTIRNGAGRSLHDRFSDNTRFILPLIAILLLTVILGIRHVAQESPKPQTLGIYTIKSPTGSNGSNKNTPSSNQSSSTGSQSAISSGTDQAISPVSGASSGLGLVGGMGGGSAPGGSVPSGSPGTAPGGSGTNVGGGTIVCSNVGSLSTQLCTACSPPLLLQPGQKALLSASGSCVSVN